MTTPTPTIFDRTNNPVSLSPLKKTKPSAHPSAISGGTANILPEERKRASFDVEKMTNFLDGGVKATARKKFIMSPTEDKNTFDHYFWERPKLLKEHVKHFLSTHEDYMGKVMPTREDGAVMSDNAMLSGSFINHYGLFLPTLIGQAGPEQQGWWLPRAWFFKIVGVYAQTELGHGSNVRGLQTVAVFDRETDTFVLNTPHLTSIKWWVSGLGKVATHALVYAQLIIDGQEYGVHIFMVQLRDENHRPLPGIEIGDVGPKLGDNANDTGFLRLENLRIPRIHMLNRFQQVDRDGKYHKASSKTNPRVHYATMVFTRGGMIRTAGGALAKAVTVATRYSCVRYQGFEDTKDTPSHKAKENKVIDYSVQRYRIFKQLALVYAIKCTGNWMLTKFKDLDSLEDLSGLPEIAATAAGLKGLSTYMASLGIEDCRKCCGGHGYLLASGVGALAADYVWQTTAEGDFIVMLLQCARFLMKAYSSAKEGKETPGPMSYLAPVREANFRIENHAPKPARTLEEYLNPQYILLWYKYRALVALSTVGAEFEERSKKPGVSFDEAWNSLAVELVNAVRAHCLMFMLEVFTGEAVAAEDEKCRNVLNKLCVIYGLTNILDEQWDGLIDHNQIQLIRLATRITLDKLRPDAVALVDAFDIPDRVLQSCLGRYDGNVYEALYESAKKSDLNQTDPFDGYEEHLRKFLDIDLIQNGNNILPEAQFEESPTRAKL